jgi:NADPH2:quinone reductase
MRAITYARLGDPSVLELVERPVPEPREGELRIRVIASGVNPTDWKSRSGTFGGALAEPTVPNHDGAGVVDKLGPGVAGFSVGDRVWVTLAGDGRPGGGTAQEYTVVPARRVFPLPDAADFDLGASVGIPGVTAHRALTVAEDGPARLHPGALSGRIVLVAGGAGAVGNAAIQLARWAGATVIATVSGEAKAKLAAAAGAELVVSYTDTDAAEQIRRVAPDGVDLIVEVAAGANAELDQTVLRPRGTISIYANDGGAPFNLDVRRNMGLNARYQFVLLYTVGWELITAAAADINQAIEDGAFRVGEHVGLPLHRFNLDDAPAAHAAVESGAVGKVLITVGTDEPPGCAAVSKWSLGSRNRDEPSRPRDAREVSCTVSRSRRSRPFGNTPTTTPGTHTPGGLMDDPQIHGTIEQLVAEEHELWERESAGNASEADRERLQELKVSLDQCWDLLRQRRALREAGRDPDAADVRRPEVVESYEQ